MNFIFAQISGLIALILVCIGYSFKNKSHFIVIQIIANFFYASAFLFVKAYVGALIIFISMVRCIYIYIAEKKSFKYVYHFILIFVILYIITTIVFWKSTYDFIPLIASIIFTISFCIKNLQLMRYILIIPNTLLIFYNIITTTYTSALLDLIEVIVIIVAIIIHKLKNKKELNNN